MIALANPLDDPELIEGLLRWLAGRPGALLPLAAVLEGMAEELAMGAEEAAAIIAGLEADGLLERWDAAPSGPSVILSSKAADALGLVLASACGRCLDLDGLRWCPIAEEPSERARKRGPMLECDAFADEDLAKLDGIPDPRTLGDDDGFTLSPLMLAPTEDEGSGGRWSRPRKTLAQVLAGSGSIRVVHLVGVRVVWPPAPPDAPCPCCAGRELSIETLCLWCCRSGVDPFLPAIPRHERPKHPRGRRPPVATEPPGRNGARPPLAGGLGKSPLGRLAKV